MDYEKKVSFYNPTKEEKDEMAHVLMWKDRFMAQEKRKRGRRVYCSICNQYSTVSEDTWRQAKASMLCPMCHRTFKHVTTKSRRSLTEFIYVDKYGFGVKVVWEFGKKPRLTECRQVLYDPEDGRWVYTRGIVRSMYNLAFTEYDQKAWRRRDCWKYLNYFYSVKVHENYFARADHDPIGSRREYYEAVELTYRFKEKLKSNQLTFIKNGLYNINQIRYIIGFDLNRPEEVLKYSAYMKNNPWREPHNGVKRKGKMNVHLLDYLNRNKISLYDYEDYGVQCISLGFKIDRPKDFAYRHEKYADMIVVKKNENYDHLIAQNIIGEKAYQKDDVEIRMFYSVDELIKASKTLHNCLSTYIKQYAQGETKLYRIEVGGVLKAAAEVCNGKLVQARLDHNVDYRDSQIVQAWCKATGIERTPTWY